MRSILFELLKYWGEGGIARLMTGAGLSFVVFAGLEVLVVNQLEDAVSNIRSLPADVVKVLLLVGGGEFLSIIGSAILTRVALNQASAQFGLIRKTD